MDLITRAIIRAREWKVRVRAWHKGLSRGQTMTEYALIMAAVAIVVYVTYSAMGNDIGTLVNQINTDLTSAS